MTLRHNGEHRLLPSQRAESRHSLHHAWMTAYSRFARTSAKK